MSPPLDVLVRDIPRRELVTLRQYVRSGSYKEAAWELGISESTARQRVSSLIRRLGVRNVTQAVWQLRREVLEDVGAP